jgi:hypothetical protein
MAMEIIRSVEKSLNRFSPGEIISGPRVGFRLFGLGGIG